MTSNALSTVILAAGKGTRMKSRLPKVLHEIAGRPMLGHVLANTRFERDTRTVLVVGPDMDRVSDYARSVRPDIAVVVQQKQLGTGDAARTALPELHDSDGVVLVVFGDTPLVRAETLENMADACRKSGSIVILGFEAADPTGYGRVLLEGDQVQRIVEHKDASEGERRTTLCFGGPMAVPAGHFGKLLEGLGNDNAQGEYYLTDLVALGRDAGLDCICVTCPEADIQGVNSRADLASAEASLQRRMRAEAMAKGVTFLDPETVYLSFDTKLGRDVTVGQNVVFGPGCDIADGVTIKAFSHLEGAAVAEDADIGPFARIRPGTEIGRKAKIGNFVETKKAKIEDGAKVNHLSYIGDARVGAGANIGAGTITCNYDGYNKFFTDIGAGAFVGSNSSLVAPVKIGDGAYLGSGSVVTKDVSADALAVARGRQMEKPGWAAAFRAKNESIKKASSGD
ncbi:bifunctional UDP-N-acetylglucosamine diphosphorylase/glucosamine-1-phosphate N-acetyltransferase GlmU [Parvibaculum sp.]|jgi:bifunctional UDP-N-acetylglucosamine pyrophosphorylase / glucosamine-1-phosphate N-acetyltransferase|uniref:bifunctional UDP-N-acetylglucosamine diphosphorylase/glucosamine-1-phosphate N-acetyltransferase GlmU n=1 Tax=Parvibaculum sp. TaxID=2024848 RepID=UPI000C3E72CF|nr:bifunctional UDP-N-acetylglucosamine diphosphorylase/glucosamine-1-phosphate N-acetyltransferase GlmU [Parvibaculum sp.]MAM93637.1 bifunctional N-acetylglucosamine-1-phosphate uridyltransferase/glucosamine-1-phosphate acetyltransferase [Parvibaculum sp.]|tara:strand:+ start:24547 stop:25908 length:1362 start_codon:yes stop_codon:yes gene_type:complete